jgi:molybdopterin converting factor small subunit
LLPYASHARVVELDGAHGTVAEVLEAVRERHPGVIARVLTEQRELRQHVNVFVGEDNVKLAKGLDTPVPDRAEVTILAAVSGG